MMQSDEINWPEASGPGPIDIGAWALLISVVVFIVGATGYCAWKVYA